MLVRIEHDRVAVAWLCAPRTRPRRSHVACFQLAVVDPHYDLQPGDVVVCEHTDLLYVRHAELFEQRSVVIDLPESPVALAFLARRRVPHGAGVLFVGPVVELSVFQPEDLEILGLGKVERKLVRLIAAH